MQLVGVPALARRLMRKWPRNRLHGALRNARLSMTTLTHGRVSKRLAPGVKLDETGRRTCSKAKQTKDKRQGRTHAGGTRGESHDRMALFCVVQSRP